MESQNSVRYLKYRFKKKRNRSISKAKAKTLVSCVFTAQLISGFVFAYEKGRITNDAAKFVLKLITGINNNCLMRLKSPKSIVNSKTTLYTRQIYESSIVCLAILKEKKERNKTKTFCQESAIIL